MSGPGFPAGVRPPLAVLLAAAALLALSPAASAADASLSVRTGADGRTVIVADSGGSEWTDTDLFDGLKGVLPGDTREEILTIRNEAAGCDYVRVWLKAVPHTDGTGANPLSPKVRDAVAADPRRGDRPDSGYMLKFLSRLSLKVENLNSGAVLFDASPDRTDGLSEPVCLGKIRRGETVRLKAVLSVPPELDNAFSGRVGEIDWLFTTGDFDGPSSPEPAASGPSVPLIQTGQLKWPVPVFGLPGILLLILGLRKSARKRKNDDA